MADTLREQLHDLVDEVASPDSPVLEEPSLAAARSVIRALGSRSPADLARLTATLAALGESVSHPLAERIGPCHRTPQLQRLLSESGAPITDEAVRGRIRSGSLIGLKTRDRRWVFPAWQFHARAGRLVVRADVVELWRLTDGGFDAWTRAAWMAGARRDLDGSAPLEWLEAHGLDPRLRAAAGDFRRRAAA